MLKSNIRLAWRAFFVFTIIFSICTAIFPAQVKAAATVSGLTGWKYRKELTVYGSSADVQTNYQKLIRVYYANKGSDIAENVAQYTTGDSDNFTSRTTLWRGQTFTAETTGTVKKVWLKLLRAGIPGATYTCAIRATAAGVPTGANLCSGNITADYVSTVGDWYEFDMGTGTAVIAGTVYAVILYSAGGSDTDYVAWRCDTTGIYTGGTYCQSTDSGANWTITYTDYDFLFQVLTSTTGTVPLRIDCEAHCQTDFDDIRFTRSDGSTLLDYWIENYDTCEAVGYADCWVELNSVVQMTGVSESSTFYMYYGNTDATAYSNGSNTFMLFEDFEWGTDGDSIATSGGSVTWTVSTGGTSAADIDTAQAYGGTRSGRLYHDGTNSPYFQTGGGLIDGNTLISYRVRKNDTAQLYNFMYNGSFYEMINHAESENIYYHNGTFLSSGLNIAVDTWELCNVYFYPSMSACRVLENGSPSTVLQSPAVSALNYNRYNNVLGTSEVWIDNIFIANWVVSQPLWGTPGAETELIDPWAIQDAKVFTGYKETGDWLIVIRYVNIYPPYYDTYDVRKYFTLQLLDGSSNILASVPVPVWGNKVGNIYLSADRVSGLNYGGNYSVRMYSIPDGAYYSYVLTADDWQGGDLVQLDNWVITSASVIGDYYDDLLTTYIAGRGEVLNATGGTVFTAGINGLSTVRPELFQVYTNPIDYVPETTSQTQRVAMSNWQAAWGADGTIMITRIANWFGIDGGLIGGMFFVIMMLVLALVAFPAGHTTAANILSIPCLGLAVWFGLDLVWLIILALFAAFLLFKNQFMDK